MKLKLGILAAVVTTLTACAHSPKPAFEPIATPTPVAAPAAVVAPAPVVMPVTVTASQQPAIVSAPHPYAMTQRAVRTVVQAPEWFVRLPEDTAEMTFAVGTATSTDEQMAYDKARMAAERKLVEQMHARISTQTNSFRADRGQAMIENFQQVTRKNARGELVGAQRVDSQTTHDGRVYKVYVLLRLPMGEANLAQNRRDQARAQREAEIRGRAAERAMDANDAAETQREREADRALERSLTPQSAAPVTTPVPAAVPQPQALPPVSTNSVPTNRGEIQLLDVDNEEYKRRRAEALAKPGAVIGQITVQ